MHNTNFELTPKDKQLLQELEKKIDAIEPNNNHFRFYTEKISPKTLENVFIEQAISSIRKDIKTILNTIKSPELPHSSFTRIEDIEKNIENYIKHVPTSKEKILNLLSIKYLLIKLSNNKQLLFNQQYLKKIEKILSNLKKELTEYKHINEIVLTIISI